MLTAGILPSLRVLGSHPAGDPRGRYLEHDMSLTRQDKFLGENIDVDFTLVDQLVARAVDGNVTIENVLEQFEAQFDISAEKNPYFVFDPFVPVLEAMSMFFVFDAYDTMSIPVEIVDTFLRSL
jgi:hypothetical protein